MENRNIARSEWIAERGYTTHDGDRIALMERESDGVRAIMWSYGDASPQFTEYADRSEALRIFMLSYISASDADRIASRRAPGW